MSKYILVTSGVCSSLGKGVAAATIGSLLEGYGLNITMVKCDPYINVDAGNISPFQHGEVYVTEDGAETDLDLGNFSRFTSINITNKPTVPWYAPFATNIHPSTFKISFQFLVSKNFIAYFVANTLIKIENTNITFSINKNNSITNEFNIIKIEIIIDILSDFTYLFIIFSKIYKLITNDIIDNKYDIK